MLKERLFFRYLQKYIAFGNTREDIGISGELRYNGTLYIKKGV